MSMGLDEALRYLRGGEICRVRFGRADRCDQFAQFEMICRCCAASMPCCSDHEQMIATDRSVRCMVCQTIDSGADLFAWFEVSR